MTVYVLLTDARFCFRRLKEGQRVLVISLASDESSRHELEKGGITQEAVATLSSVHERQM